MFKISTKYQGFSYKLYFLDLKLTWIFVYVCAIITVFSGLFGITDLSTLNTAVGCAFAQLGVHTGFIIWKAKVENCRKYKDVNRLNDLLEESEDM